MHFRFSEFKPLSAQLLACASFCCFLNLPAYADDPATPITSNPTYTSPPPSTQTVAQQTGTTGKPNPAAIPKQQTSSGTQTLTSTPGLSESLWGNLILTMAYQRDVELQKILTKMDRLSLFNITNVVTISGLGAFSNISSIARINNPNRPISPYIISLTGNGLSLLSLGADSLLRHRYKKQLLARQTAIKEKVEAILEHLEGGGDFDSVRPNLESIIGVRATEEFNQLWLSSHP